jgi:hypothetical protein
MRRWIPLAGVMAIYAAALGCHHVGGKCDCQPDNIQGTCNYYSSAYGVGVAPNATPPAPIPVKDVEKKVMETPKAMETAPKAIEVLPKAVAK